MSQLLRQQQRARIGFTPYDRFLIYATGGLAYGEVKSYASVTGVQNAALGWSGSKSDVKYGWTLGAGAEYALTNNWTLKGEYLYYDLGKHMVSIDRVTGPAGTASAELPTAGHIGRVGLNYRF